VGASFRLIWGFSRASTLCPPTTASLVPAPYALSLAPALAVQRWGVVQMSLRGWEDGRIGPLLLANPFSCLPEMGDHLPAVVLCGCSVGGVPADGNTRYQPYTLNPKP